MSVRATSHGKERSFPQPHCADLSELAGRKRCSMTAQMLDNRQSNIPGREGPWREGWPLTSPQVEEKADPMA